MRARKFIPRCRVYIADFRFSFWGLFGVYNSGFTFAIWGFVFIAGLGLGVEIEALAMPIANWGFGTFKVECA